MKVLVVAATELEIKPFLEENPAIDVLIAGVGVPATIYNLQKRIYSQKYDLIIQAGIAGTYLESFFESQKVVVVNSDLFADIGILEKYQFSTIFEIGFEDLNQAPFQNGILLNKNEIVESCGLDIVNAITVNTVTDDQLQNDRFFQKYQPVIESMEGAAFHYVCLQENVSFLQIRSISNMIGERNKSKWKMKEAIEGLNTILTKLVANL